MIIDILGLILRVAKPKAKSLNIVGSCLLIHLARSPVFLEVKSPLDNRETLESYFLKNTEIDPDHSGCWRWRGSPVKGRRYRKKDGVMRAIYQIAYEVYKGPIPDRHVIHHTCKNLHCINPDHLEALTRGEHMEVHLNRWGEENGNAVLTEEAVREIFNLVRKGQLQRKIAAIYGLTRHGSAIFFTIEVGRVFTLKCFKVHRRKILDSDRDSLGGALVILQSVAVVRTPITRSKVPDYPSFCRHLK